LSISTPLFRLHRAIIDPVRGGPGLTLARMALRLPAAAYGLGVRARNGLYRAGWRRQVRAEVPVISVGNITAGGTGKTPLVSWLARMMLIYRLRPAVLSRGYGARGGRGIDDENAMLARMTGGVPVVVCPNRLEGARRAVREHGANVLILDDGFQHRRLARDLDIVLIDAVWPFGGGHLLPRGLLREPLKELRRAGALVITRAELVTPHRLAAIRDRLREMAPDVHIAVCRNVLKGLRRLGARRERDAEPAELARGRWAAFCGIGNPEGFLLTLRAASCRPALFRIFADHHHYTRRQLELLLQEASDAGCTGVVTTEKDAVKLERLVGGVSGPPIYAAQSELEFTEGAETLTAAILEAASGRPKRPARPGGSKGSAVREVSSK